MRRLAFVALLCGYFSLPASADEADACAGSVACSIYSGWLAASLNQLASSQVRERALKREAAEMQDREEKTAEFWKRIWDGLSEGAVK